jgi:hypothetical protein
MTDIDYLHRIATHHVLAAKRHGSAATMTDHEQNKETYNYDAWGEHVDTGNVPTTPYDRLFLII